MSIPQNIREEIRQEMWEEADRIGWAHMSPTDKARTYEDWSRDPRFGGTLGRYMDPRRVRTYLKNSIMGGYGRARLADEARPLRVLRLPENTDFADRYQKPHGALLRDGRMIAWGKAASWRDILLALHERTFGIRAKPYGMVLFRATGKYREDGVRDMVEAAAMKLGVDEVAWLEV